jgi:glycerol transport system ATP-binding protein
VALEVHTETWSHRFARGTLTVVLGRNGAGKTSLARMICGLPSPLGGTLTLGGQEITHTSPRDRSVALVFQEFVNYPSLSVFDNIASPLAARNAANLETRVRELARMLALEDLLDRLPDALSGGQQQRVAIARALAKDAEVLVLDEPFVNLDYKLREALAEELLSLLAATDKVVLYTSSDPHEALSLGDEVVLIEAGCKIQAGPPLEVLQSPATLLAADLMCDPGVNVIDARVAGETLSLGDDAVRIPTPDFLRTRVGAFRLAVRPDDLTPDGTGLTFPATVLLTETNGSDTYAHLEVAGAEWVAQFDGLRRFNEGDAINVAVALDDLLVFDE